MIAYGLLGPVTARESGWTADLAPQQQLLVAALVMERGRAVPRQSLIRVLWDEDDRMPEAPESALKRVAAEVRARLRTAPGYPAADNPLPVSGDAYRLVMEPRQADALRFRAQADDARRSGDPPDRAALHAALREWGPDATGLFGGHPLAGLRGNWAESNRDALRGEYRDIRFECLWQDFCRHDYPSLVAECRDLGREPEALLDEKFLAVWMVATYRAGHRTDVARIYQRATEVAKASETTLSGIVQRLAEDIRTESSLLNGPADLFGLDFLRLPAAERITTTSQDSADRDQGAVVSDKGHTVTFSNGGSARIGVQAVEVNSPVTINMERDFSDADLADQPAETESSDDTGPSDTGQDTVAVRLVHGTIHKPTDSPAANGTAS